MKSNADGKHWRQYWAHTHIHLQPLQCYGPRLERRICAALGGIITQYWMVSKRMSFWFRGVVRGREEIRSEVRHPPKKVLKMIRGFTKSHCRGFASFFSRHNPQWFPSCGEKAHIQQGTEATWQQFGNVWGKHQCRMRSGTDCLAVTMDALEQLEDGSEVNVLWYSTLTLGIEEIPQILQIPMGTEKGWTEVQRQPVE